MSHHWKAIGYRSDSAEVATLLNHHKTGELASISLTPDNTYFVWGIPRERQEDYVWRELGKTTDYETVPDLMKKHDAKSVAVSLDTEKQLIIWGYVKHSQS